jgi:hypothetical protein
MNPSLGRHEVIRRLRAPMVQLQRQSMMWLAVASRSRFSSLYMHLKMYPTPHVRYLWLQAILMYT